MKARSDYELIIMPDDGCLGCIFASKSDGCMAIPTLQIEDCGSGTYVLVHKVSGEVVDPVELRRHYESEK